MEYEQLYERRALVIKTKKAFSLNMLRKFHLFFCNTLNVIHFIWILLAQIWPC
jgi:hypothetical protein